MKIKLAKLLCGIFYINIVQNDENNNKNGRCYLFDRDHISKVIDFLDNQPYRVVKISGNR